MISLMDAFSKFLSRWRSPGQDNIRPCIEVRGSEILNCKTTVEITINPDLPPRRPVDLCPETIRMMECVRRLQEIATPDNPHPAPATWGFDPSTGLWHDR